MGIERERGENDGINKTKEEKTANAKSDESKPNQHVIAVLIVPSKGLESHWN